MAWCVGVGLVMKPWRVGGGSLNTVSSVAVSSPSTLFPEALNLEIGERMNPWNSQHFLPEVL